MDVKQDRDVRFAGAKQIDYLEALAAKTGLERFDTEFAKAIKGTDIAPRGEAETTGRAIARLSRAAARKLITALVGNT